MSKSHRQHRLDKRFVLTHCDDHVYAVGAEAVRDLSPNDEEFTHFGTFKEFPRLIPKGEIWVTETMLNREGMYFIANALTRLIEMAAGVPEERADAAGLNVERMLRERWEGLEYRRG